MEEENKDDLMPNDWFLDDTPKEWVNEKKDLHGLNVRHHHLICHLAIKAGYFPDTEFPHIKDKCLQYHTDRNLQLIPVDPSTFYKTYSGFEYVDVRIKQEGKPSKKIRTKYITYALIEKVLPFVEQWYPLSLVFVQTLNTDRYRLDGLHFYWVYREILEKYNQSMTDFVEAHCPHIEYNTFKSLHLRNFDNEIPIEIKEFITPYLKAHYPDVLEGER